MTTEDVVYSLRFSLIKVLPEPGFHLCSTVGESCVLTARLHMLYNMQYCCSYYGSFFVLSLSQLDLKSAVLNGIK